MLFFFRIHTKNESELAKLHGLTFFFFLWLGAGVCRSSWERSGSSPAGSHEYVDVLLSLGSLSLTSRYIVEVNVAAEFETARPSAEYQELLLALPPVLVARPETFKEVAAVMCAADRKSVV